MIRFDAEASGVWEDPRQEHANYRFARDGNVAIVTMLTGRRAVGIRSGRYVVRVVSAADALALADALVDAAEHLRATSAPINTTKGKK